MDWATFLEVMLVDEHAARAKYKMASELASDTRVKEIFEQLRYEEEVHVSILEKEIAALKKLAREKEKG